MKRTTAPLLALVLVLTACASESTSRTSPKTTTTAPTSPTLLDPSTDPLPLETDPGVIGAEPRQPLGDDVISDIDQAEIARPEAKDGLYGWGAWQPAQMNRPLVKGTSSTPMSPERRKVLGDQLSRARTAALKVGTVAEAEAAGYQNLHPYANGRGYEFANFDYLDDTFDIDHPEILAFPDTKPDTGIAAIAYYVTSPVDKEPPPDLPLEAIPWHYHWAICQVDSEYPVSQDPEECADLGGKVDSTLDGWMVDLWLIPGWENPWGLISSQHPDLRKPQ